MAFCGTLIVVPYGTYLILKYQKVSRINISNKTCLINDPCGRTHSPTSSDYSFHATFRDILKSTDGWTDGNMCENNYYYRPGLWVNRVDQYFTLLLLSGRIETWIGLGNENYPSVICSDSSDCEAKGLRWIDGTNYIDNVNLIVEFGVGHACSRMKTANDVDIVDDYSCSNKFAFLCEYRCISNCECKYLTAC